MKEKNQLNCIRVDSFDGQTIWKSGEPIYELGNFLGSGAHSNVFETEDIKTKRRSALKILTPIGYKVLPHMSLRRSFVVAVEGLKVTDEVRSRKAPFTQKHVWWIVHPNTKQTVACYADSRFGGLRELSLTKCVAVWGWGPHKEAPPLNVVRNDLSFRIPNIPEKFVKFCENRDRIFKEISNMRTLGDHPNVCKLYDVLELVQDSKTTIFLSLELAEGGELFDRIEANDEHNEDMPRKYFSELLSGLEHCHRSGVCHRDLKPENLLLSSVSRTKASLKIADFGLSALFLEYGFNNEERDIFAEDGNQLVMKRLKSVVGTPSYVSPEVLQDGIDYDGTKSDAWSVGVILYAMLSRELPFGRDLLQCPRFRKFSNLCENLDLINSIFSASGMKGRSFSEISENINADSPDSPALNSNISCRKSFQRKESATSSSSLYSKDWNSHNLTVCDESYFSEDDEEEEEEDDEDVMIDEYIEETERKYTANSSPVDCKRKSLEPQPAPVQGLNEFSWLFPHHFSDQLMSLLIALLHPNPNIRLSISDAMTHPWSLLNLLDEDIDKGGGGSDSDASSRGSIERTGDIGLSLYERDVTVSTKDEGLNNSEKTIKLNDIDVDT